MIKITLDKEMTGSILDIGGGGEGIIGRLYQNQVIAIDNLQEELDEAPDGFDKVLMDATNLQFEENHFDHITFFFSLMYMRPEEQKNAICEAARVLKSGGNLHIWDCNIFSAYPEPFCADVEIHMPSETVSTTYGVCKLDGQNSSSILGMCTLAGLKCVSQESQNEYFHFKFQK